jgi:ParB family transcriptional regulator, chromosome partitioning protein
MEGNVRKTQNKARIDELAASIKAHGLPATDIAARFGKSHSHVLKILKLARVSPKILKAYRAANLALKDVMAFTVTDDHDAQERVFAAMTPWQGAQDIRPAPTENEIAATDKRVKFVTLKAYEKAGGTTGRDLCSDYAPARQGLKRQRSAAVGDGSFFF